MKWCCSHHVVNGLAWLFKVWQSCSLELKLLYHFKYCCAVWPSHLLTLYISPQWIEGLLLLIGARDIFSLS
jgi:hypothetical protein